MIQRYLGNKAKIISPLLDVFAEHADPGDHVVDLFSGSLTVSLAMKKAGYRVSANDSNLLSYVIGQAFLVPSKLPEVDVALIPLTHRQRLIEQARRHVLEHVGFKESIRAGHLQEATALVALTAWLNEVTEIDFRGTTPPYFIYDTYTEEGANSAYRSLRGRTGRRRFFSGANAQRIDLALTQLRIWVRQGVLNEPVRSYLLASLMRAVEKIANTQGTFHDFPRDRWDQRALQSINIQGLPTDPMISEVQGHAVGKEMDSREYVRDLSPHKLLYLDPPYNFRQYSAYYFLLNLICRYTEIDDLPAYFSKVTYVRGQNPDDDFNSTFCKTSTFIRDMGAVMRDASADTVVVSYYTGRNHWSDFDTARSDTGLDLLSSLMTGTMFETGSLRVTEVERLNYASYGGYKARKVQELILVANKRKDHVEATRGDDAGVPEMA